MALDYIDGFEHQYVDVDSFDATHGLWTANSRLTGITFPAGRTGQSLKIIEDGATATNLITVDLPASQTRCWGMYFRIPANPSVQSIMFDAATTGGTTNCARIRINTAGTMNMSINGSGAQNSAATVSDNAWHRLDMYLNSSGTTHTIDWKIDGVNQTSVSLAGQTARDPVRQIFGSTVSTHTLTVEFDDFITGTNGATDFPIANGAAYTVQFLTPTSDGTHAAGVNVIEDQAGTDIVSPNAFPLLNEIPATTTDYIRQVAVGASNYAEVNFSDTTENNILFVGGCAFGGAANASAPNGTIRIVDSGGSTVIDLFSGNMGGGSTLQRALNLKIPDPGGDGWTNGELNGIKLRVGFSSNASGAVTPRWTAALVQFAAGPPIVGGSTAVDPFGMSGFFGG
jgi:hypothetical protein